MVSSEAFREVLGNFAAGVTVVTLPDPPHGITVNAFASLSLSPTLVLICIDHETDTHDRLSTAEPGYCVNILAADQRYLGEHFARMAEHGEPFVDEPTRTDVTGAPVFENAVAYVDCTVADRFEAGDHTVFVGAVEGADVLRPDAPVLTYFRGEWGELGP